MKRKLFLVAVMLICSVAAFAQNRITGKVVDASGPLFGVAVIEQGTTNGAATDANGNYSLTLRGSNPTIEISCIGYATQRFAANAIPSVITLVEDTEFLEETVVIGYGVQKKSDITGAIASLKNTDLANRTSETIAQALAGKTAGVNVISTSGAPGSSPAIRIRGFSSNTTSEPLYIVDGLKVSSIAYLDPENVESMEILKDAASAAIYGAQAGNGVVLITTKKGKQGEGHLFYNYMFTSSAVSHIPTPMNAKQYIDYVTSAGVVSQDRINQFYDGHTDTNWQDVAFEKGMMNRHTLGFEGGNDRGDLYVSLTYLNNNGIVKGDNDINRRITSQVNASYKIKNWLTVGLTNSINYSQTKGVSASSINGSVINNTMLLDPLTPDFYTSIPSYVQSLLDNGKALLKNDSDNYYGISQFNTSLGHPIGMIKRSQPEPSKSMNVNGTFYVNVSPIKELVFTSRFGYRLNSGESSSYNPVYYLNTEVYNDTQSLSGSINRGMFYQWENFVNFNKSFDKHTVTAMAGMSFQRNQSNSISGSVQSLKDWRSNFRYLSNSVGDAKNTIGGSPSESTQISYFARLGWSYDNRYNVQANFRADAFDASKLSKKARWGFFPSVSASWNVINEDFMQEVKSSGVLTALKVRASWGINGSVAALSGYQYATTLQTSNANGYDFGTTGTTYGIYPTGRTFGWDSSLALMVANDDLKWEESRQLDFGIDARLFRDRLSVALDFFSKNTTGLLVSTNPPMMTGGYNTYVNAGKVHNHGFEFQVDWKDKIGDFGYSISANGATLKNIVSEGPLAERIGGAYPQGLDYVTYFEGNYPVWYLRTYRFSHLDKATGQAFYFKKDGKTTTATPTDEDRDFTGSGIPKFTYGITINLDYKGFDLTVFGSGAAGVQRLYALTPTNFPSSNRAAFLYTDAWSANNHDAKYPAPFYQNAQSKYFFLSDQMVMDASYFKLKQIQLGYTLPAKWASKVLLSKFRIYASLEDFVTFTKYPGFDPETSSGTTSSLPIDEGAYPNPKKVIFGVNITF